MNLPPPPPRGQVPPSRPIPPPPPGWYTTNTPPPPFGQPHAYGTQPTRTSRLAVAAMVLGILWLFWLGSLLAVIFGHVSLSAMKNDRTIGGRGMAIAGLVLGYVGIGILVLSVVVSSISGTN